MGRNTLVSIIINNYNYGRFLSDAINSALSQTYTYIEVIVVDDGSTDNSMEIIAEYGNKIKAVLKKNGGQASAFNAGFSNSKGLVIVFLDADDMLLPTAVENSITFFDNPEIVKVHWPMWRVDVDAKRTGGIIPANELAEGNLLQDLIENGPLHSASPPNSPPTSGNAWSRKFLEKVLPVPETEFKTWADYYLTVLTPIFGSIKKISEPFSYYRIHGSNITSKPVQEYIKSYFCWFEKSCETMAAHLKNVGIEVDTRNWPRKSWYHKLNDAIEQILAIVPAYESFILVDGNEWNTADIIAGRTRIPFMEREGKYWGEPSSDESAILEVERLIEKGAAYIFFAFNAFWVISYYSVMYNYLKSGYSCVIKNDLLIGFHLGKKIKETTESNQAKMMGI